MHSQTNPDLDLVLSEYLSYIEMFDANILHRFLTKYPMHKAALLRCAVVQLTYLTPTRAEIEAQSAELTQFNIEDFLTKIKK